MVVSRSIKAFSEVKEVGSNMGFKEEIERDEKAVDQILERLKKDYNLDIEKLPELKEVFDDAIMVGFARTEDKGFNIEKILAMVINEIAGWSRVKSVESDDTAVLNSRYCEPGQLVKIRPCGNEYDGKTYLGVYIGELATGINASLEGDKVKTSFAGHNPAILIPSLNKVVYGAESWWGKIDSMDELEEITDEDIDNVPYVKALRAMEGKKKE